MKVCVVDPSFFTQPYDQHLCAGLAAVGVDVTLCGRPARPAESVYPHEYAIVRPFYRGSETRRRGRHAAAWLKAIEHLRSLRQVTAWMRNEGFDALHFQWSPLPLADVWWWRRLRRRMAIVFTVHDTEPFLGNATSRWQRLGWRRLLDLATSLIVHTTKSRADLLRLGIPAERIAVIPHGLLRPARPTRPRRDAHARRTLLVFGEIKPYKGIDVLLRAVARIPADVARGWQLVIAGRPRMDLTELKALAARSAIPVVWRLEYVPDAELERLFSSASVAVFPYRNIDASGALMLTLPFAVPIVASRVGVFSEMLTDGQTALLTPPGEIAALADALVCVMSRDDVRAALGGNIARLAAEIWTWERIAAEHRRVYGRAIANQATQSSLARARTARAVER